MRIEALHISSYDSSNWQVIFFLSPHKNCTMFLGRQTQPKTNMAFGLWAHIVVAMCVQKSRSAATHTSTYLRTISGGATPGAAGCYPWHQLQHPFPRPCPSDGAAGAGTAA